MSSLLYQQALHSLDANGCEHHLEQPLQHLSASMASCSYDGYDDSDVQLEQASLAVVELQRPRAYLQTSSGSSYQEGLHQGSDRLHKLEASSWG